MPSGIEDAWLSKVWLILSVAANRHSAAEALTKITQGLYRSRSQFLLISLRRMSARTRAHSAAAYQM